MDDMTMDAFETRWDRWVLAWDQIVYWSKLDPGRRFAMIYRSDPAKARRVFDEIRAEAIR